MAGFREKRNKIPRRKKKTDASSIGPLFHRLFPVGNRLFISTVVAAAAGLNDFKIAMIVITAAAIAIAFIVVAAAITIAIAATAAKSTKLIAENVAKQCNNTDESDDPEDHAKDSSGLFVHSSTTSLN